MDRSEDPAASLKTLCQLSTRQLITLTEGIGDELLRRAHDQVDGRQKRLLHLAAVTLVELRGRLRMVRALELENPSAAAVPDTQHGAATSGASLEQAPSGATSTTTAAAEDFCVQCSRKVDLNRHIYAQSREARVRFCSVECRETWFEHGHDQATPRCPRCTEDLGHEGECFPVLGSAELEVLYTRREPAPTSTAPRSASAADVAARAEGAEREGPEGDRTNSSRGGRVDLAHHLAVLKGGAA